MIDLIVKKLHPEAVLPTYATDGSACFDLYALHAENGINANGSLVSKEQEKWAITVQPFFPKVFGTGLSFEVPEGYALMVYSRSGHGFSQNVRLANATGVIDSDYRGELKIKLTADKAEDFQWASPFIVSRFDRIAQAMLIPIPKVSFLEVQELSETGRGTSGFGSTGK